MHMGRAHAYEIDYALGSRVSPCLRTGTMSRFLHFTGMAAGERVETPFDVWQDGANVATIPFLVRVKSRLRALTHCAFCS